MIGASGIFVAAIALLAFGSASATAGRWHRPVTVSDDGVPDRLDDFPGFVSSPDARHVALVTLREHKGIVVYPVLRSGRLRRGSFLPMSKDADYPWQVAQAEQAAHGQYPDAAINDSGVVAVAWRRQGAGSIGNDEGSCGCAIRVDVGTAGGHFSSILLTQAGRAVLGVQTTPIGQVQVLWEASDRRHVILATIDKPWRTATERAILPETPPGEAGEGLFGAEAFLIDDAGHPQVVFARSTAGVRTVLLAEEPFNVALPTGLSWPPEEGVGEPGWSLLSDGHGLAMAVVENVRRNALEVATPDRAGGSHALHRVSRLVLGKHARPVRCGLAAAMNARGEALVAWTCLPSASGSEVIRAALLDPEGHVIAMSRPESGFFGNDSEAAVAFDDAGRGVVAREEQPYASIFLDRGHFSRWRPLPHGPNESQPTVQVAVTTSGVGLATWVEEPSQAEEHPSWAGRIRLDRSEPEPTPVVPPDLVAPLQPEGARLRS